MTAHEVVAKHLAFRDEYPGVGQVAYDALPDECAKWQPADWLAVALMALDQGMVPSTLQTRIAVELEKYLSRYDR